MLLCISEYFLNILTGHQFLSPVISCATVKIIALKYKPHTFSMVTSLLPACYNILGRMQSNFALRCVLSFFVGGKMRTLKVILKGCFNLNATLACGYLFMWSKFTGEWSFGAKSKSWLAQLWACFSKSKPKQLCSPCWIFFNQCVHSEGHNLTYRLPTHTLYSVHNWKRSLPSIGSYLVFSFWSWLS